MRKLILGTLLVPALAGPAVACNIVDDPVIGPEWNCDSPFTAMAPNRGGASQPPDPCTGAGLPHGTEACNNNQTPVWDGGRTDALGVAAGVAGVGAAVTGNSVFGAVAAALGLGAAVSNAADNGCCGDAGGAGPSGATTSTATGDSAF